MTTALTRAEPVSLIQPRSIQDMQALAQDVFESRLFPGLESPQAVFTLMMLCDADGLHPMQALRRYDIVKGRPAMKADAMLAEFIQRGGKVEWVCSTHERVEAVFHAPGLVTPLTVAWTLEDGKRAGLAGKGTWANYPRQMMRSRVISEGIRMAMPAVVVGIYTSEEAADFEPREPVKRLPPPEPVADVAVEPPPPEAPRATMPDVQKLGMEMRDLDLPLPPHDESSPAAVKEARKAAALRWCSDAVGRPIASRTELTGAECKTLIAACKSRKRQDHDPVTGEVKPAAATEVGDDGYREGQE